VIIPLEQKIKSITNIDKITSTCYYNFGTILVQFTTAKSDVDAAKDLKDAIDQVYPTLPTDANYPTVKKVSVSDTPVYSFSVAGNVPTQVMYNTLKGLEDQIKSVA